MLPHTHTHTLQRQPTEASERERQREKGKRRQARLFSHPLDVDCTLFSPWHHHGTGSRSCWKIRCADSSIISLRWPCTRAAGGRNASGSLRRTAACSGRLTESARARACVHTAPQSLFPAGEAAKFITAQRQGKKTCVLTSVRKLCSCTVMMLSAAASLDNDRQRACDGRKKRHKA